MSWSSSKPDDDDRDEDDEMGSSPTSFFLYGGWKIKYALLTAIDLPDPSITLDQTIVFIHGTPWSSDVFQPLTEALLARRPYPILLYDLPGFGDSQEFDQTGKRSISTSDTTQFAGDTSVRAQAEILAALLQHVGIDGKDGRPRPAVIAHDIGGTIALRAHLLHGCNFKSMLLMSTNAVLPWGDSFHQLVRSQPDVFIQMPPNIFEAVVRAVVQSACFNPKVLQSGWEESLLQPWFIDGTAKGQRSFVRQIAQTNDVDVAEMLNAGLYELVRCPVKILLGEQDQWIPRDNMRTFAAMLKSSLQDFVLIPDAGHLVMLDQPVRVAVEVLDWLSGG